MKKRYIPYVKNFELTSYCNLNCPICVEKTWKREHLSLKLLETILEKNKEVFEGQAIWLHYRGEPLLHPQLKEVLDIFEAYHTRTRFSTNGLLLTPQKIDMLLNSPLESLVVSVITDNRESYEQLRGSNKYDTVRTNVDNLIRMHQASGSHTKIQVMGLNYGQGVDKINGFVKYYNDLGVEVSIHKFSDRVLQSRYHPEFVKHPLLNRLPCKWIFNDIIILCDGSITTCYFDLASRLVLCNLRDYDYSILDVWNSDIYQRIRAEHENLHFNGACKDCTDWVFEHPNLDKDINTFINIFKAK